MGIAQIVDSITGVDNRNIISDQVQGADMNSVTDALGFTDHAKEERLEAKADESAAYAREVADTELSFQREQYDAWKDIYGDLQEDLGTYYKNLNGNNLSAKQIEAIQLESQLAQDTIDTQLSQRGLQGSGLEAEALMRNTFATSGAKAEARSNADQLANEQKMQFLGLGLGQGTQMLGTMAGVSATGANIAGNFANTALGNSTALTQTGLQNTTSKSEQMGSSITGMFSDINLKENIKLTGTVKGINFYTWDWNEEANALGMYGSSFGVMAQEVKEILPDSVTLDNFYSVDYSKITDYLGAE